jgi:SAM-dependent methyltransferase
MERLKLCYMPQFDQAAVERNLRALLVTGVLAEPDLDRRIAALKERFRVYKAYYPHGFWAPGLVVTTEMRNLTEFYLPLVEIRRAFDYLFSVALSFSPVLAASTIHNASTWLDALHGLQSLVASPDPACLLRSLIMNEGFRRRFIFANFLQARYGGGFGRYPLQAELLRRWLAENRSRLAGGVRCLDAACGTGEGTYELALFLMESGFAADSIRVRGVTLEPLELFAAAHCCFPHDPRRTEAFRLHTTPLRTRGAAEKISFTLEDLTGSASVRGRGYDIVLCNGLLGGPFLHEPPDLLEMVRSLSGRLNGKGILLAASRFHGGWKKLIPDERLREIFRGCGLRTLPVAEGVAGEKMNFKTL